ncbi:MAG: hypothetical protein J5840_03480 [Lachnospiraceae bacterium]|nr:hypothetical protein [Lachnospiraceae bacterium]
MSKDLTKEYKEAVMNDLPDLWGRIEAAIDAQENEKNKEIKSETVKKEETETIKTESNLKIVGNETVKETVVKKKRRMPVWLVTAVPFAAILLVVIVPLSLFGLLAAGGAKSSQSNSAAMSDSAPMAAEACDTVTTCEASVEMAYEDISTGSDSSETLTYKSADMDLTGTNAFQNLTGNNTEAVADGASESEGMGTELPSAVSEKEILVNEALLVKVDSFYENEHGQMADLTILEVNSETNIPYSGFEAYKAGQSVTARIDDYDYKLYGEYEVSLYFVPDKINEFWAIYHIEE